MRIRRGAIEAIVIGVLILVGLLHGLDGLFSDALPVNAGGPSVDSTTPSTSNPTDFDLPPLSSEAAAVPSDTLAAMLAAELLLSPINFYLGLPLIST